MDTAVRVTTGEDETIIDVRTSDSPAVDLSVDEALATGPDEFTRGATEHRRGDSPLQGKVAIVTGGSSGIGREIALGLVAQGARVCIVGRAVDRLKETSEAAGRHAPIVYLQCDLGSASEIDSMADFIERFDRPVDILVHAAGVHVAADVAGGSVVDLDEQYLVNLRGPYLVSQRLMSQLQIAGGHVVFLNSLDGLRAQAGTVQFAMTKFGLRALADSLRDELAGTGVRVTSIFAGGLALSAESRELPDGSVAVAAITASDIASCVVQTLRMPASVQITDLRVTATGASR